jgi:hypothetical protein
VISIRRDGSVDLVGAAWAWTSPPYRGLDLDFAVRTTDPGLGRVLDVVFDAHRGPGSPSRILSITGVPSGPRPPQDRYDLRWDDELLHSAVDATEVLPLVVSEVNLAVVRASAARHVLLHAAAVARGEHGVILPAAAGAGKTTLTAGLVRAGLDYVTDEIVAIGRSTGLVQPYPKALSIKRGSWDVLHALRPPATAAGAAWFGDQWHVDVRRVRTDAIAGVCRPSFVVAPCYEPNQPTTLTPMRRAEALVHLMNLAFTDNLRDRDGFELVAEATSDAECYRMTVGDLDTACRMITALLG